MRRKSRPVGVAPKATEAILESISDGVFTILNREEAAKRTAESRENKRSGRGGLHDRGVTRKRERHFAAEGMVGVAGLEPATSWV